jgi:nucleotide-binding universal stress UspA family protein
VVKGLTVPFPAHYLPKILKGGLLMSQEQQIKKILCPVDFSRYSLDTLNEAAGLARVLEAELVILNVVNRRIFDDLERYQGRVEVFEGVVDQAYDNLQEQNVVRLRELLVGVDLSGLDHGSRIAVGTPWAKILEAAQEEAVDMIVMGARGRGSLIRQIRFGSTAEKIFRRAKCRVMFVR